MHPSESKKESRKDSLFFIILLKADGRLILICMCKRYLKFFHDFEEEILLN